MVEFLLFMTELHVSVCSTSIFYFQDNNLSKSQSIFTKFFMCALILWSSALGLLVGKFRQFLTELSAHDTKIAGHYPFMFY